MTLGEKISALRAARGMKQDELAAALGVSRQSVSKWETGVSVPELDRLVQLAGLFGVTLDELAGLEPPSPEPPAAVTISRPSARVIVGAVLLGVGLLWTLLYLALWRAAAARALSQPLRRALPSDKAPPRPRDRLADHGRAHTLHMALHKHPHVRRIQPRVL